MHRASTAHRPPSAWTLTRRAFVAACLVGCSQLTRRSVPGQPAGQTWALISDTHIGPSREATVRGTCMAENLERVVAEVVSAGPDRVLICGDLALASGEQADYATFRELISPLTSRGIPLHVIPGNHDNRDRLMEAMEKDSAYILAGTEGGASREGIPAGVGARKDSRTSGDFHGSGNSRTSDPSTASTARLDSAVPGKIVSSRVIGGVHWVFLDSLEEVNGLPGRLGRQQLDWLARRIDATPSPAVVCLHHNPQHTLTGLRDADEFLDVVLPRRRVKAVLFGHTHEFRLWRNDGLQFVNLPACGYCLLVKPNRPLGWVLATVRPDGMGLDFRTFWRRESGPDAVLDLSWRSDA